MSERCSLSSWCSTGVMPRKASVDASSVRHAFLKFAAPNSDTHVGNQHVLARYTNGHKRRPTWAHSRSRLIGWCWVAPGGLRTQKRKITCRPYHPVGSKFVSAESLPKTGVSGVWAGDFREILAKVATFRKLERRPNCAKSPKIAGFSRIKLSLSLVERVAGWGGRYRTGKFRLDF
jgi:hypothetical protein